MISFFLCMSILLLGYFIYSKIVVDAFEPNDDVTPAYSQKDNVDYVPMKTWKVFLIQLLNIAGTGPVFGALMGATFGPIVFLWITFGSVFIGAVHDYLSGMISVRDKGASISEIIGKEFGTTARHTASFFIVILLILVTAVFIISPAKLLASLTPETLGVNFWVGFILVYYIIAALVPIDKLIGKIYPIFGIILFVTCILIISSIILKGYYIPEISLRNLHPEGMSAWPFMFITVACGAISGFHSTQSPMMARCIKSERDGSKVFFRAMIAEGMIALVWAAAGVAFYNSTGGLLSALNTLGQSGAVYDISTGLLGKIGGILAIVGVVILPITSGDTALRSARITIADSFSFKQKKIINRCIITVPIFIIIFVLTQVEFQIVWRYFSWTNQTLATLVLWTESVYIFKYGKNKWYSLLVVLPATFMSGAICTYILMAEEGVALEAPIPYIIGIVFALACFLVFSIKTKLFSLNK